MTDDAEMADDAQTGFMSLEAFTGSRKEVEVSVAGDSPTTIASMVWRILSTDPEAAFTLKDGVFTAATRLASLKPDPISSYGDLKNAEHEPIPVDYGSVAAALVGVGEVGAARRRFAIAILAKDPTRTFGHGRTLVNNLEVLRDPSISDTDCFIVLYARSRFAHVADADLVATFRFRIEEASSAGG